MTRFFEMFSKRVVKKARKCGPIKRKQISWRASSTCPLVTLKIHIKFNLLSGKSNGERELLSNQCNNNNISFICMTICSYSIAKALRLSYNLY